MEYCFLGNYKYLIKLYKEKKLFQLEKKLKHKFKKRQLLVTACIHSSFKGSDDQIEFDNERMEFLGDSVLNLVVAENLFRKYPSEQEGFLSIKKNELVSKEFLSKMAEYMEVEKYIFAANEGVVESISVLEDTVEAIFGAIFLDISYKRARTVINKLYDIYLSRIRSQIDVFNPKGQLQEYFAAKYSQKVEYKTYPSPNGHNFISKIYVKGKFLAEGIGKNKKDAEKEAAFYLCKKFGLV